VLAQLGRTAAGHRVDVLCPGFVADCLETLEEIALEHRAAFLDAGGGAFRYIPCLNDDPAWIAALADLVQRHLQGWPTQSAADGAAS
jgi:ferrochelatase